jgi:anti-sigma B factor antagonist
MTLDGSQPFSMSIPDLCVVDREVEGVTVIDLAGPLIRELPVRVFRDQIQDLLRGGTRYLAVNLAGVAYADSFGVGGLVSAYNLARQPGGKIRFYGAPERLAHTLERLRLNTVLELYEDEASAVSSFRQV